MKGDRRGTLVTQSSQWRTSSRRQHVAARPSICLATMSRREHSKKWMGPNAVGPESPLYSDTSLLNFVDISRAPHLTTKALFILYDIFGYSPQILEGADLLAKHYNIVMPDFWQGRPAPLEWMPMDGGPVREDEMDKFCNGPGETQKTLKRIEELKQVMGSKWPEVEDWGLVGYCWGGWVSVLTHPKPFM